MNKYTSHQISRLLVDWSNGDENAPDCLMPLVYEELRKMAKNYPRRVGLGHTFETTDHIHEAYLKLAGQDMSDQKSIFRKPKRPL